MGSTESGKSVDIERYKVIRDRWDKEDTLLISRTGVFLTTTSLLLLALGFQAQNRPYQIGVAIVGLSLSFLWLITSLYSFKVIRKLYQLCVSDMPYGLEEIPKIKPILFRPTTVFCKLIPSLVIGGWLALIIWMSFI